MVAYKCFLISSYVLDKDVLKHCAIYPPDTKPVGEFRGCKVYLRSDMHSLQSTVIWLKDARSVKVRCFGELLSLRQLFSFCFLYECGSGR